MTPRSLPLLAAALFLPLLVSAQVLKTPPQDPPAGGEPSKSPAQALEGEKLWKHTYDLTEIKKALAVGNLDYVGANEIIAGGRYYVNVKSARSVGDAKIEALDEYLGPKNLLDTVNALPLARLMKRTLTIKQPRNGQIQTTMTILAMMTCRSKPKYVEWRDVTDGVDSPDPVTYGRNPNDALNMMIVHGLVVSDPNKAIRDAKEEHAVILRNDFTGRTGDVAKLRARFLDEGVGCD